MALHVATRSPISPARGFDRAFDQLVASLFEPRRYAGPVVDATWNDDEREYVLTVDLPGVPASAVDVEVSGNHLTIDVSTQELQWQRSIRLGERLDPEKVSARHVDGRLTVRIGSVDQPVARKIEVATTPPTVAIEASSETADESAAEATSVDQSSDTSSAG